MDNAVSHDNEPLGARVLQVHMGDFIQPQDLWRRATELWRDKGAGDLSKLYHVDPQPSFSLQPPEDILHVILVITPHESLIPTLFGLTLVAERTDITNAYCARLCGSPATDTQLLRDSRFDRLARTLDASFAIYSGYHQVGHEHPVGLVTGIFLHVQIHHRSRSQILHNLLDLLDEHGHSESSDAMSVASRVGDDESGSDLRRPTPSKGTTTTLSNMIVPLMILTSFSMVHRYSGLFEIAAGLGYVLYSHNWGGMDELHSRSQQQRPLTLSSTTPFCQLGQLTVHGYHARVICPVEGPYPATIIGSDAGPGSGPTHLWGLEQWPFIEQECRCDCESYLHLTNEALFGGSSSGSSTVTTRFSGTHPLGHVEAILNWRRFSSFGLPGMNCASDTPTSTTWLWNSFQRLPPPGNGGIRHTGDLNAMDDVVSLGDFEIVVDYRTPHTDDGTQPSAQFSDVEIPEEVHQTFMQLFHGPCRSMDVDSLPDYQWHENTVAMLNSRALTGGVPINDYIAVYTDGSAGTHYIQEKYEYQQWASWAFTIWWQQHDGWRLLALDSGHVCVEPQSSTWHGAKQLRAADDSGGNSLSTTKWYQWHG